MFKVYLAGYIQGVVINECLGWRKKIRDFYENWKGKERYPITWLDPLNGEHTESITPDGLKSSIPGKALMHRDYQSVKNSDLIIANLDTFGQKRPLTGTVYELAWAWLEHKSVIVITNEQKYKEHPFIKDTASIIVSTVDELLDKKYINYFFKGFVTAEY